MGVQHVLGRVQARQMGLMRGVEFAREGYISGDMVARIGLEAELKGHTGCVNCLQWNETGTLLASGSDDQKVVLWKPHTHSLLHSFHTGHRNNIFAVQFVPESGDSLVLTAAGDNCVRLHTVNRNETQSCIQVFACHSARVKRLAITKQDPHLFWTAGEDGRVLQIDLRTPPMCTDFCNHALINLASHCGNEAEVKCIAINPTRPELLAVGANDPFVRVFDRRMLTTCRVGLRSRALSVLKAGRDESRNYEFPEQSAQYFVAGHLPMLHRRRTRQLAVTNLTFSPKGDELLVNLGGEQIYLFDVIGNRRRGSLLTELSTLLDRTKELSENDKPSCSGQNGFSNGHTNGVFSRQTRPSVKVALTPRVEALKIQANLAFEQQRYSQAISLYSKALQLAPSAPVLYANRAAALMKRAWDGDAYAATRDCYSTLLADSSHFKALFRLARCLADMKLYSDARNCLKFFKIKYPEHAKTSAFDALEKDVRENDVGDRNGDEPQRRSRKRRSNPGSSDDSSGDLEDDASVDHRVSALDQRLRDLAVDYKLRYLGHCNTTTDIKEVNFFGGNGEYIVAGSDDGTFLIWDHDTCSIVAVLRGDESIVNCLQPHPTLCLLATSGIEQVVRLWSPLPENEEVNERLVLDVEKTAQANQRRMNTDPLEVMLSNIGYHFDTRSSGELGENASVQCRQS